MCPAKNVHVALRSRIRRISPDKLVIWNLTYNKSLKLNIRSIVCENEFYKHRHCTLCTAKPDWLMVFQGLYALYSEHNKNHINGVCEKNTNFLDHLLVFLQTVLQDARFNHQDKLI
jgi:hypothetical protein